MAEFIAVTHWTKDQYMNLTLAERDAIIAAINRAAKRK